MSEMGINGALRPQDLQLRQISAPPRKAVRHAAADAYQKQQPAAIRPSAPSTPEVSWHHEIQRAMQARPTNEAVSGSFNKFTSNLSSELNATGGNNAEAFARIGSLQTAFEFAASNTGALMDNSSLSSLV
tara:strand:- start:5 stop:394 length:390 start_codon:yes stop_codon:yes gene_type:complete